MQKRKNCRISWDNLHASSKGSDVIAALQKDSASTKGGSWCHGDLEGDARCIVGRKDSSLTADDDIVWSRNCGGHVESCARRGSGGQPWSKHNDGGGCSRSSGNHHSSACCNSTSIS